MTASAVEALYERLLTCWNERDAVGFGDLFTDDGSLVGFDGSQVVTRAAITEHLQSIFRDHQPARYLAKVREIREVGPGVMLARSVVGMVPPGGSDINPDVNAIQALVAVGRDGRWLVAHYQTTPAAFHGRPETAEALSAELRAVLSAR